ncbi:bis(5'-adenosyl)-triphosphatase enpp4 isoform X1 [Gouania willdenowi]|uniref:bis(5'-adenosyl)-triphosphatase enpp4 isoform X1 n=1 Tax=Gouania willdenowi TaxID=441366 RepID=UPI001055DCB7|nr:bis(5'-adenosyl)-triphosphatase ENPP4 isoform X1 [Gouania willdenowi]XP_028318822.1 bis(5'-adenosyl)-triphosphatase ENPP4 isoform X1 [Gouania willdenowi]XP_028318831.1 bis(5'-adenosyl)-triphosphatase ENPP4 isoform X1 [Gouania willdenowi]XP_028318841.1 bis(5'-adenosyl)-triphosphatase ENPP4 isoform X1 [Gouania willdenowi]XP_028318850.1 bis(5'-adenosyl)-triphosphatase ENPP4 isoform X1 [Gouania willdenowi]
MPFCGSAGGVQLEDGWSVRAEPGEPVLSEGGPGLWTVIPTYLLSLYLPLVAHRDRMLPRLLLFNFLCGGVATSTTESHASSSLSSPPPPLLIVSFDGFRADYLKRFPMPNLSRFYNQGVLVEQLTNVFTTKTFPNHYSLVTGLYAESHGMVASNMYDPTTHKHFHISNSTDAFWWNEAEPIWITALDSGYKTAAMMWPGSDVNIRNRTPTHYAHYDKSMKFPQRLGNVTHWLLGDDKEEGVKFAALYWEEPDGTGHIYGPENTTAMTKTMKQVDDNVGLLMSELNRTGLWGHINVVITSDHGMAQCAADRLIRLDNCLGPDNYTLVDMTPVAALIPRTDAQTVFALLKKCHAHMTAYMRKDFPDRFHYRNNDRIQPILLIADEGWTIVQRGNKLPRMGDHGYDNSLPSMHPFLAAVGPSFRRGHRVSTMDSVDLYPLMCRLLAVPPRPNNGSLDHSRCLLQAESCWDVPLIIGLVVGVLLVLSAITLLFRFLGSGRPSGPRPFQRLQIDLDDDDDDDPLLE